MFKNVMNAVNEAVEQIERNKSSFGYELGETVLYKVKGITPSSDIWHEAKIIGFTEKSIHVEFPTGYRKYAMPHLVKKK